MRHVVGRPVVHPLAEQHHRRGVAAGGQLAATGGERADDEPVDELGAEAVHDQLLRVELAVGLVDEHRPAAPRRCLDDVPGELGEVRDLELRDREREDAGPAATQLPRCQVRPVVELAEGGVDLGPGARGHVRVAVDDVGDGLHRDAGQVGDVDEPGATRLPPLGRWRRPGARGAGSVAIAPRVAPAARSVTVTGP